jgi:ABC-2 type transport system permease protein
VAGAVSEGRASVVGVLIRMRWRVFAHMLRSRQAALTVIGAVIGLVAAALTLAVAAADFDEPGVQVDFVAAMYLLWTVGWIVGPILTGGGDETLRPEHFALLPLSPRRLAAGLLGAAFVGVPAIVTAIAFCGLFLLADGAHVVVALFAVPLQLVFVVLAARVTLAALGAALRSRRGRDLGILLAAVAGFSGFAVQGLLQTFGPMIEAGDAPVLSAILRWSPSGWGTVAVTSSWPVALAALVALAAANLGLLALWGVLLVRRTTRTATAEGPKTTGRAFGWRTPLGAVIGKELRTWTRDARRRAALVSTLPVALIMTVGPLISGAGEPSAYGGLAFVAFGSLVAGNLYGMDGSSIWHTLVVPGAAAVDVRGRQLAWLMIIGPVGLVLAIVLPAVSDAEKYPWVLGLLPALLGGGAGLMMLMAVFAAYPMPDRKASPFAAGGSPGASRALLQILIVLLLAVVALPAAAVVLVGELLDEPVVAWLGVPVGIAVGLFMYWWCGNLASRRLDRRGPELLAEVAKPV